MRGVGGCTIILFTCLLDVQTAEDPRPSDFSLVSSRNSLLLYRRQVREFQKTLVLARHKVQIISFSKPALKMFSTRESFKSCGMEFQSVTILFEKCSLKSVLDLDAMRLFLYAVLRDNLKFWSASVVNIMVDSTLSTPLIIFKVWTRSRRRF